MSHYCLTLQVLDSNCLVVTTGCKTRSHSANIGLGFTRSRLLRSVTAIANCILPKLARFVSFLLLKGNCVS